MYNPARIFQKVGKEVGMGRLQNHPPSQPRNGGGRKVSERGLLSIVMLMFSIGALGIAMLAGGKLVLDILGNNPNPASPLAPIIVTGLAYAVGWVTAMVAIRVYGNLILPMLVHWMTWGCLVAVCALYILIMQRMYAQPSEFGRFVKYLSVMAGGLAALVGLHLIIEDHNLRPFSLPLLVINLIHLGMIVVRYVFDTANVNVWFLWKDLVFFFAMVFVAVSMLAHWGILEPIRKQITNHFDRNSIAIRSKD